MERKKLLGSTHCVAAFAVDGLFLLASKDGSVIDVRYAEQG
jgi:hypothetical protein